MATSNSNPIYTTLTDVTAIDWSNAVVPGLRPVLIKGIQAALTRARTLP